MEGARWDAGEEGEGKERGGAGVGKGRRGEGQGKKGGRSDRRAGVGGAGG